MDATKFTGSPLTDGFFTFVGGSVSNTTMKTGGNSQPDAASPNKFAYFTTTGAGTIDIVSRSGTNSSEGATRDLFVAQVADDGTWSVIGRAMDTFGKDTAGKADNVELKCNLPAAAKYYILSTDGITISAMTVTFDSSVATLPLTPIATSASEANTFNPLDWSLGLVADKTAMGNYTMAGAASRFKIQGSRTVIGKTKWVSMGLDMAIGDGLTFAASAAGNVSFYAEANVTTGLVGTLSVKDETGAAVTITAPTFKSSADAGKAPAAVTFAVESGKSYTMTCDVESVVYWIAFAGV